MGSLWFFTPLVGGGAERGRCLVCPPELEPVSGPELVAFLPEERRLGNPRSHTEGLEGAPLEVSVGPSSKVLASDAGGLWGTGGFLEEG